MADVIYVRKPHPEIKQSRDEMQLFLKQLSTASKLYVSLFLALRGQDFMCNMSLRLISIKKCNH